MKARARPRTSRPEERRVRRHSERLPDEVIVDGRRRVVRDRIDLVGNDLTATLRWCATHNEPVWEFNDGSSGCPYDSVTETSSEHDIVDGPWEHQRSLDDEAAASVLANAIGWIMCGGEPGDHGYDGRIEVSADEAALVRRAADRGVAHLVAYLDGQALT